jgi:hypothetical protein
MKRRADMIRDLLKVVSHADDVLSKREAATIQE